MTADTQTRFAGAVVATLGAIAVSSATAQEWTVLGGVAARTEYNDNYFFTGPNQSQPGNPALPVNPESAFTLSVIPFVAAARRTEVSEVTALLSVGGNKVWGLSPSEEYLSGSFFVNGSLREDRSTWEGNVFYTRSPSLQNVIRETEVVLALAYTDAAVLRGSYNYALTDRWSIGATVGGYANRYDSVEGTDALSDDRGYNVGGALRYAVSDRMQLTYLLGYSYYTSDVTSSDVVTTTVGVVHQFSPHFTVSASVGGFWSDTTAKRDLLGQQPVVAGESRSSDGIFFGGNIGYAFSEQARFDLNLTENLAPSSIGTISKSDNVGLAFSHQFSERLTGRVGASYVRTSFPSALDDSYTDKTVQGQVGLSYQLAERWKLEAGYQYTRTEYSQSSSEPNSNVVFVSVGYNWPGASFTGWVGRAGDMQGLPGGGPLSLPERSLGQPGSPPTSDSPLISPFDQFTLP